MEKEMVSYSHSRCDPKARRISVGSSKRLSLLTPSDAKLPSFPALTHPINSLWSSVLEAVYFRTEPLAASTLTPNWCSGLASLKLDHSAFLVSVMLTMPYIVF